MDPQTRTPPSLGWSPGRKRRCLWEETTLISKRSSLRTYFWPIFVISFDSFHLWQGLHTAHNPGREERQRERHSGGLCSQDSSLPPKDGVYPVQVRAGAIGDETIDKNSLMKEAEMYESSHSQLGAISVWTTVGHAKNAPSWNGVRRES